MVETVKALPGGLVRPSHSASDIFMSFLGLVPAESSTGETVRGKGLTLAGNRRARRVLIEAAWTYRYPTKVGETLILRRLGDAYPERNDAAHRSP